MSVTEAATREGYTVPAAGRPLRARIRSGRYVIVVAAAFLGILILTVLMTDPPSNADLSTRNSGATGGMAVAEILRDQGVKVGEVSYLSHIHVADPDATTLVIALPSNLVEFQISSVFDYPGDLVFLGSGWGLVDALGGGFSYDSTWGTPESAHCTDPDALAAGKTTAVGPRIKADAPAEATVCFADSAGYGTYIRIQRDGRLILLITDPVIAMNKNLADEGNAALILRALGKNPRLVWYVGAYDDTTSYIAPTGPGQRPPKGVTAKPGFWPTGTGDALFALGLAGLVAAFWKGRRMGPLVTEALPVVVHASESTRGRGRLYRRARAIGRASATLRAAAAERMGRRLGVPRSAEAAALIAAVAQASRRDSQAIERLLYGPPPQSESDMMDLANELDTLEREVLRP